MPTNWDDLRKELGEEYGLGAWFCVPETLVITARGRAFANKSGRRRVVLASPSGPNAVLYPRSASIQSLFRHEPHIHELEARPCRIDKLGWVALDVPVTVESSACNESSYSCSEPEGTGLVEEIRKSLAP